MMKIFWSFIFKCTLTNIVIIPLIHSTSWNGTPEDAFLILLGKTYQPIQVIAFFCWNTDILVDWSKKLYEEIHVSIMVVPPSTPINMWPNIRPEEAHHIVFLADLSCEGTINILQKAENKMYMKAPFRWIVSCRGNSSLLYKKDNMSFLIDSSSMINNNSAGKIDPYSLSLYKENIIPEEMKMLNLMPDSDFTVIYSDGESWDYEVVYKRSQNDDWFQETINSSTVPFAVRRLNLMGAVIRVCYVLTDNNTIHHLEDSLDKHIDTITKVNYVLTNHVIDYLNGSRIFSFESSWGYRASDGSWSGMIGELTTAKVDIGGSPLFVTTDRVPVIDYIAMPTATRSKFVFRQPKLSYMSNVFLLPFRGPVWACGFSLLVVMAVALMVAAVWENRLLPETSRQDPELLRSTPSDVTILTLGAMCQQGSSMQLKGIVGRIVILLIFLSLMFLYTSYSANIVALLQSSSSRIKTLSDLLNSRLKFGVHDTVFNRYYFSTASEPVRKAIYEKKVAPKGETSRFITIEDGVKKLQKGLFAFHMEIGVGYKLVEEIFLENEKCGLQEIQYLQVVDPWLAVQKNSSYKEMFKIGFRRLQESGLQFRENWKFYTRKPHCSGGHSNFISVGIVDCSPAMMVLLYGAIFAIILLMLEFIFRYKNAFLLCRSPYILKQNKN